MTNKVDWTKVPTGTLIHVRDYNDEQWNTREFISYNSSLALPFVCKNSDTNVDGSNFISINWMQAKLIEEQTKYKPNTKVDWTKVPAGTTIRVRDYDTDDWGERDFIRLESNTNYPYICTTVDGYGNNTTHETGWTHAELIEEQSDNFKDDSVPAIEDVMNLVEEYSGSHDYYIRQSIRNKIVNMLVQMRNTNLSTPKAKPKVQFEGDDVLVPYQPVTKFFKITKAEHDLIIGLYPKNKISIIKFMRNKYQQGLKETKDICDMICDLNN